MKNIAVIGAGYWGKNLVKKFVDLGSLSTICDSDKERLAEYNTAYPDVFTTDKISPK